MPVPTLNLIGAGRVGRTLGRLWHQAGVLQLQDVLTTTPVTAQKAVDFITSGRVVGALGQMRPARAWLLAVPDSQIADCAAALALQHRTSEPALVFHASGALAAAELSALQGGNWLLASAHCLLSFADPATAVHQFAGSPCALEGDAAALAILRPWFAAIGAHCFELKAQDKLLYHAGAVWATNFAPVLQAQAEALWQRSGMPAQMLAPLRARLLRNACANLLALGPAGALTGPAARGDTALVQKQAAALTALDAQTGAAYTALSQLAERLARQGRL